MTVLQRYMVVAAMVCCVIGMSGQKAAVERVELLPFEVIRTADQRRDLNGEACALVRVEVLADDVTFSGNVIGDVEHRTGHYRVYLSPGTRMMRIESASFLPLMINFPDYGIERLQPNCTYAITLSLPEKGAQRPASAAYSYLMLTVSPADARVVVDGKICETHNGLAKVLLRSGGTYTYHVEAPGYLAADGEVTMGDSRLERAITLRSTKGTVTVKCENPATEIYINGECVGKGTWQGELFPNDYLVEGRLESHRTVEQVVTVAANDSRTVTLPSPAPITGSINVDYEPAGSSIAVDGTHRGTTPDIIRDLLIGTHNVTVSHQGYTTVTLEAKVTEGELTTLTGALREAVAQATAAASSSDSFYKLFKGDNGKWGITDNHGKVLIEPEYDYIHRFWKFSEGLIPVKTGEKWGYIDRTGKMTIAARYDEAEPFYDGVAEVGIYGKRGYIDKAGNVVIPLKYEYVWDFNDGLLRVTCFGGAEGIVDRNNREIFMNRNFSVCDFKNGFARIHNKENGRWGFIDSNGRIAVTPAYDFADDFHEGMAQVTLNDKVGYIDENGKVVITPQYDFAGRFSDGLAVVKTNGKFGAINLKGEFVIPAVHELLYGFSEGLAGARTGEKYGFIDSKGKMVIAPDFDDVSRFSEGFAAVKINGKWGYVNTEGRLVIPARFDTAWGFSDGKATVILDRIYYRIDKTGAITD